MDNERKQQLKSQYKQRKVVGGVYRIVNVRNGRFLLAKTADLHGAKNLYDTGYEHGQAPYPRLRRDWDIFGKEVFQFEVLEEWEKGTEQTDEEFRNDVAELYDSWEKKLPKDLRY